MRRVSPPGNRQGIIWECRCDCGGFTQTHRSRLKNGKTQSCGCIRSEKTAKRNRESPPSKKLPDGECSMRCLVNGYRQSARRRGVEWGLSREQCRKLFGRNCFYCGQAPSQLYQAIKGSGFTYNGIDRIDNEVGYVDGNVVACCGACNHAKASMPFEAWKEWVRRVTRHFQGTAEWTL